MSKNVLSRSVHFRQTLQRCARAASTRPEPPPRPENHPTDRRISPESSCLFSSSPTHHGCHHHHHRRNPHFHPRQGQGRAGLRRQKGHQRQGHDVLQHPPAE